MDLISRGMACHLFLENAFFQGVLAMAAFHIYAVFPCLLLEQKDKEEKCLCK